MTKTKAVQDFKEMFAETLKSLRGDTIAKNELWWDYADSLCKQGYITEVQYDSWSSPYQN